MLGILELKQPICPIKLRVATSAHFMLPDSWYCRTTLTGLLVPVPLCARSARRGAQGSGFGAWNAHFGADQSARPPTVGTLVMKLPMNAMA